MRPPHLLLLLLLLLYVGYPNELRGAARAEERSSVDRAAGFRTTLLFLRLYAKDPVTRLLPDDGNKNFGYVPPPVVEYRVGEEQGTHPLLTSLALEGSQPASELRDGCMVCCTLAVDDGNDDGNGNRQHRGVEGAEDVQHQHGGRGVEPLQRPADAAPVLHPGATVPHQLPLRQQLRR